MYVPEPAIVHHEELQGYEYHGLKAFLLKRNLVLWFHERGRPVSARGYALLAWLISVARAWRHRGTAEAAAYRGFARRFRTAAEGILSDRPAGPWFGPPQGPFED